MISVNLTGRLTRDPELKQIPDPGNGGVLDVCQLRVAARDRRGDTVFLDIAEWGRPGRAAAEHLRKGSMIAFSGELRFRERQREDGNRQYLSAVGHIEFLGRGSDATAVPDDAPDEVEIPF